jgi:uncharacterized protein DUF5681
MSNATGNYAPRTRGKPFERGNPGRPQGSRNRATIAAEALLDGQAEALTQIAIEKALAGDMQAVRLCLERIAPVRRDRPIRLAMPSIRSPADVVEASAAILAAVAAGDLTPSEAAELGRLLDAHTRAIEAHSLEQRVRALEGRA